MWKSAASPDRVSLVPDHKPSEKTCFRCGRAATGFLDFWPNPTKGGRFQTCQPCSDLAFEMSASEREADFDARGVTWQGRDVEPGAAAIRKLRGRIEWRHPQTPPDHSPSVGTGYADLVEECGWYVVWTEDWQNRDGGGKWTTDLACFTPLDDAAREILRWVSPRRAPNVTPSSAWIDGSA